MAKNYLENRTCLTKISRNGTLTKSSIAKLTIDTPQGSVLGPLLFLIMINNIHLNLSECGVILFADDTTIYSSDKDIKSAIKTTKWCKQTDRLVQGK